MANAALRRILAPALVGGLALGAAGLATAAPHVPARDDEIVERLPSSLRRPALRKAAALHARLRRDPADLSVALTLATRYVAQARAESDPRFLGYAQAALAPWWHQSEPPVAVLVLRATIRQSSHAFAPALDDLARALRRDPGNVQAWLTQATVQQVVGAPLAARASCEQLAMLAPGLVHATCLAAADSALGRAPEAYAMLAAEIERARRAPKTLLAWSRTLLAEIAERLGRYADAERHFRAALEAEPGDTYLLGAYADFLLDRGRAREVLRLIPADTRFDPLLLRLALAADQTREPEAGRYVQELHVRLEATRARGDAVHLREEARFALYLRADPAAALELAQANWQQQKEPADARILLEAAAAAGRPDAAAPVLRWLDETGLESVVLAPLAAQLREPS